MVRQLKDKLLELLRHDDTKVDHLVAEIQRVINGGGSSSDQHHHQGSGGGEATPPSPATTFLGSQPQPPSSAMVRSMVLKTLNYSDPVYNLLSRRLQNLLRTWLLYPGHYAKPAAGDSNGGDNGPSHGAGSSSNSSAPVNPLGIRLRTGLGSAPSSGHGATASNSAATGNPPSVRTGPLGSSADTLLRSYGLEPVEPEMRKLFTRINTLVDYNRLVYGVYYDRIFMELVN
ncbi:hypothetical protein BJ085DRAFT_27657 [Dimargaris cristalligena]|uniref:Uncharacterized protein n=1 Tax=Dimargaris cristalligena TaxID=215637 RepID=A0A4P9ZJB7_9FUNG|nr:hypothetical protein BJ085DRAFT_27657 [Dimargaris cristalligena]|eukprot:RKP33304.1 hypothetical protein BJ085DRAFT_27657 [Dimargaris cristalligena]